MLSGGEDSLNWKSFEVSRFQSFLASWFPGFSISWFIGFKVSKLQIQQTRNKTFISCLLLEIDPILPKFHSMFSGRYWSHNQDFKKFKDGSSWFFGASVSQENGLRNFQIPQIFLVHFDFFDHLMHPGVSADKNSWFWGSWARPEIQESFTWVVFGFSHNGEKLLVQNESE